MAYQFPNLNTRDWEFFHFNQILFVKNAIGL